ncbi:MULTISPECIES: glucuronyl esterase domain-containing protein [Niastella]|uniref:Cadherin repeat domain-containing protein n=1 Tax=Niastella soli TaxID=2821487 RepID=A0ABS3YZM8_9BACT|nr:cadherin domain-containing protein [Niastella soli]MBO9203343.1 cadherin repeat domain-containing protein [Niastella soli]
MKRILAAMQVRITIACLLLIFISLRSKAQVPLVYPVENTGAGYPLPPLPTVDQLSAIAPLPDPFMWSNGSGRSTSFADWARRRSEIKAEIENYEIGPKPNKPDTISASWIPGATPSSGTLQVTVTVNGQTLTLSSNVSLPSGAGPFPAVIGMNSLNGSLPADVFISRNIARITFSHNQVTTYPTPLATDAYFRLYPNYNRDNIGQYSAWAWGVSRIIDGLELVQANLPIDLKHLGVTGCSYAGKMALFAGAFDERIALTIAQESGGGGAPAWRVSETLGDVEKLGATSHEWFKESMFQFAGTNVSKLPHDHHELMAMVAPRALLVTGNTDFTWLANPSCYVSARAAQEVWKTFGVSDRFGFYIDGGHNHCAIPDAQRPAIEAFIEKFLLGNTNANTAIAVNPYPDMDYQRWYKWWGTGNPELPAEPVGIKIWMEPECAIVGTDWQVVADTAASNGRYVVVNGLNSTAAAPAGATGAIVLPFTIDSAAAYNVMARLNCLTANDDSYWIKFDNGAFVTVNNLATSGWMWMRLTSANLTVGQHTLTIAYREDGAKLDKVLLTTSSGAINGKGTQGSNCGQQPVIIHDQAFSVTENANNNAVVAQVAAADPDADSEFQNWAITGGTGVSAFAIDAPTGKVIVKDSTLLDFDSPTRSYTLTLTVTDGYNKSAEETIALNVANVNDNAPVIPTGISFALDGGACNEPGTMKATDADDTNDPGFTTYHWQLVGGTGAAIFALNEATGKITIADLGLADLTHDSYTLLTTVSDGLYTTLPQTVTVTMPGKIKICHNGNGITTSRLAAIAHIRHGDCIGACAPGPDYPAFKVTGNPNPSNSSFLITIKNGRPTEAVSMKVYNAVGGFIEQRQNLQTGQSFRIGQNYQLRLYYLEFTQGLDKEVLLLLKL